MPPSASIGPGLAVHQERPSSAAARNPRASAGSPASRRAPTSTRSGRSGRWTGTCWPWILTARGAVEQLPPARALRLKADQQHGVPRIGQRRLQVMQDAAAGRHPARRDDDRRHRRLRQLLRFGASTRWRGTARVQNAQTRRSWPACSRRLGRRLVRRLVVRRLLVALFRLQVRVELVQPLACSARAPPSPSGCRGRPAAPECASAPRAGRSSRAAPRPGRSRRTG